MKVLFYVGYPLAWAKGGYTAIIRETQRGLEAQGIQVQWLHPEDDVIPESDLIHYWSRPPNDLHWQLARRKKLKLILAELHPVAGYRPKWTWRWRGGLRPFLRGIMGKGLFETLGIGLYTQADALVAVNSAEAEYMIRVFGADPRKTHVVPSGVDPVFFDGNIPPEPFNGLICLAYIQERKNSVALARRAKEARVPVKFVGSSCFCEDHYMKKFQEEVDQQWVFWEGEVRDKERICALLRGARGSVLSSDMETQPIAMLESLACGTPVMGPDSLCLRSYFGNAIRYCGCPDTSAFVNQLRAFYGECCAGRRQSFPVLNWRQVSEKVAAIYETVLGASR